MGGSTLLKTTNAGLGFFVTLLLARFLGADGFGVYVLALTAAKFIALPIQMGLPVLLTREISQAMEIGAFRVVNGLQRWSMNLVLSGSLVVLVAAAVIYYMLKTFGGLQAEKDAVVLAIFTFGTIPTLAILNRNKGVLSGYTRVALSLLPEAIIVPLLLFVFLSFGFKFWEKIPATAMAFHMVSAGVAALIGLMVIRLVQPSGISGARPIYEHRDWLQSLVPLTALSALTIVRNQTDILMLGLLAGVVEVAHYRVAAQIAVLPLVLMTIINAVSSPRLSAAFTLKRRAYLQRVLVYSSRVSLTFALSFLVIFIFFGGPAISIAFGAEYSEAYFVTLILGVGAVINASCGMTITFLNMTKNERVSSRLALTSVILNIVANLTLIPLLGALGAAIATTLSLTYKQARAWKAVHQTLGYRTDAFAGIPDPNKSFGG